MQSQLCIDCGIAYGLYQKGMLLRIDFERHFSSSPTQWKSPSGQGWLRNPENATHERLICETCLGAQEFEYDPRQCLCLRCSHTPRGLRLERRFDLDFGRYRGAVRSDWECLNLNSGVVGPICNRCSTVHAFNVQYHRLQCISYDTEIYVMGCTRD